MSKAKKIFLAGCKGAVGGYLSSPIFYFFAEQQLYLGYSLSRKKSMTRVRVSLIVPFCHPEWEEMENSMRKFERK